MSLDQLIIASNSASREQIDEALENQRVFGGRLESHLFRLGYVSEEELVAALSAESSYAGICLSGIKISEETLNRLPAQLAWRWQVLPTAFESASGTLTVACEDPGKEGLVEILESICPGTTIDLRIALGDTLRSCLARHYRQPTVSFDEPETVDSGATGSRSFDSEGHPAKGEEEDASGPCRVLLYDESEEGSPVIAQMLSHQDFKVTVVHAVEDVVEQTHQKFHQALILVIDGGRETALGLSARLWSDGIDVSTFPTYLVLSRYESAEASELLKAGFEDVLNSHDMLDLLLVKLGRLRERLSHERAQRQEIMQTLGTHGSLTDMNVIDLLQALGPTGKTARISVSAHGQQLTVYLDHGRIIYAECDEIRGPEAVYCALGWRQGVWSVDPVPSEDLPEPNNDLANEAVLLDGCRRLDELGHRSRPPKQSSSDSLSVLEDLN